MNIVGVKVKRIRELRGWSQEQLAAKCNLVGWDISRGTLAKIEAKIRRVTDFEVVHLAKALNVREQDLFSENEYG